MVLGSEDTEECSGLYVNNVSPLHELLSFLPYF